jgi:hypothetical protein
MLIKIIILSIILIYTCIIIKTMPLQILNYSFRLIKIFDAFLMYAYVRL